ncbi:ribonuclease H-like domain-containing protein [Tanacetum coccineum]
MTLCQGAPRSKEGFDWSDMAEELVQTNMALMAFSDSEPEFKGYGHENSKKESNIVCESESDNSKENSNKSLVEEQVSQVKSSFVQDCGCNTSKSVSDVEPKKVRKNNDALTIEDWVSDDEEQDESKTKPEKKTVIPIAAKIKKPVKKSVRPKKSLILLGPYRTPCLIQLGQEVVNTARPNRTSVNAARANRFNVGKPQHDDKGFVDIGCSRHMTGNIAYLSDFKQFDGGYVGKISGKGTLKTDNLDFEDLPDENQILFKIPRKDNMYSFDMKNIVPKQNLTCLVAKDETSKILKRFIQEIENLVDKKVKIIRSDNGTEFKNKGMDDFCREKGIKREYSVARTPQQNGVAERRNMTLIEAARTMVLVVKPHNKTPYELFRGFKPALSFMRPFGCHVTILNTLEDSLASSDGKCDKVFFIGYSLSSKAFRVYNTRTKRVEENLHIRFLENKPMIEGTGQKWLFDIDSLTQSINCVPATAGTVSNDSAGTSEENNQDCIVMPIWKDTSYFDSPTKNIDNGESKKTADNAQKQVEIVLNKEKFKQEMFTDEAVLRFSTASSNEEDIIEEEPEVDLGNITNSYVVPTTPNTRIHKDHPIDNVIGKVQSTVQTRRMSKPTSKQEFLSNVKNFCNSNFNKFGYWWISLMERRPLVQNRLISWQCKKRTVVATSTTEAEYVATASCCGQLLWIQNQLLDYGYNFVNTVINIDNNNLLTKDHMGTRVAAVSNSYLLRGGISKEVRTPRIPQSSVPPDKVGDESLSLKKELSPKFVETHNVVAFLEKPKESDGFAEIIDFLKANSVSYDLTVTPYSYTSVFEQFWATAKERSSLEMHEGIDCLNATIFEELARMGKESDSDHPTDSTPIHIIDQPSSSSQPKKDKPSKKAQRQEAEVPQDEAEHEESVPTPSNDPQPSSEDSLQLTDLMRLERRKMSRPTGLKRLRKVGMSRRVESSEDQESLGAPEDASKQGRSIEDIDADVDVSLVDETQEKQNDDLMFDSGVLEDDVMHVEAKVDGKDEQSKKPDDSTAGEAVTTASIDDSVVPTTNEEITLAQTLIQIKAAKPKVVTTAATTATAIRPKDRWVVVHELSEFRVPQKTQPSSSKDKRKGIMIEPEVPLKRKDQIDLGEQIARAISS